MTSLHRTAVHGTGKSFHDERLDRNNWILLAGMIVEGRSGLVTKSEWKSALVGLTGLDTTVEQQLVEKAINVCKEAAR